MSNSARLIWACFLAGLLGTFLIVAIGDGAIATLVFTKRDTPSQSEEGGGGEQEQVGEANLIDGEPQPAHLRSSVLETFDLGSEEQQFQNGAATSGSTSGAGDGLSSRNTPAAPLLPLLMPAQPTFHQQRRQRQQQQQAPSYHRQHYHQNQQQQQQQLQQQNQYPYHQHHQLLQTNKLPAVEEHYQQKQQLTDATNNNNNHGRPFDVAQIQCNNTDEGFERFACPTADHFGRFRCIEDRLFCDGYYDCPGGEDEERVSCMYYKLFVSHIDILTNTFLTWMKKQNRQNAHRTAETIGMD